MIKGRNQQLILGIAVLAVSLILVGSMLQFPGAQVVVETKPSDFTFEIVSPSNITTDILVESIDDAMTPVTLSAIITPGNDTLFSAEMWLNSESIKYDEFAGNDPLTLEKEIICKTDLTQYVDTVKNGTVVWTDTHDIKIIVLDIDNVENVISVRFKIRYTWETAFDLPETTTTTTTEQTIPVFTAPISEKETGAFPMENILIIGGFIVVGAIAIIVYRNRAQLMQKKYS